MTSRLLLLAAAAALSTASAWAKNPAVENVQKTTDSQIRHLVEPLLDKYCADQCKLLNVSVSVDLDVPDEIAPGFDDFRPTTAYDLAPTQATLKLLVDDRVGPNSRRNLLELLQTHLDNLDYPTRVDVKLAHFPAPLGSDAKIADLRDRVTKQFQARINELIQQFCPEQCLLADFNLKTDVVNSEESQYGAPGEYLQDGGTAIKIREIGGTLLMDESLTSEERANILEMAKLRTNSFKNVALEGKAMKFPHPIPADGTQGTGRGLAGNGYGGMGVMAGTGLYSETNRKLNNEEKRLSTETRNNSTTDAKQATTSTTRQDTSDSKNQSNTSTTNQNQNTNNESQTKQERFERFEKIERVESGDAIQTELNKFKVYGLVFASSILSLLIFIAMAAWKPARKEGPGSVSRVIQSLATDPVTALPPVAPPAPASERNLDSGNSDRNSLISKRFEIERLLEELMAIFSQHPKVAKYVFSRILTEEGVEVTAQYIHLFGEGIVVDMLRDPSLQSDMNELMEFYAKTPMEIEDAEKLDLLRKLHNRTIAGKLLVLGNRSSNLFEFLSEMDYMQILEMIRAESLTVKAIVLTQTDPQKRSSIYQHLDEDIRMKLLAELSRIDHLPRDYIFNVANALKRKRRENPRLNTESLPGSEVLVTLLERTGMQIQKSVVKNLELSNPDSARTVKSKLVSLDTLRYLRDSQLLEVVLSLKHDELLQFLKGAPDAIRRGVYSKSPKDLTLELQEELETLPAVSREAYGAVERKVLNRMKLMANDGLINLIETNERMFANGDNSGFVQGAPKGAPKAGGGTNPNMRKVSGW